MTSNTLRAATTGRPRRARHALTAPTASALLMASGPSTTITAAITVTRCVRLQLPKRMHPLIKKEV